MKTGWPPGLLQDDCRALSRWFSSRPDARLRVREAAQPKEIEMTEPTTFATASVAASTAGARALGGESSREAFEKWLSGVHLLTGTWNPKRNCYDEFECHLAFQAWCAALAAPAVAEPAGWQPIETAPKDGSTFLAWCGKEVDFFRWQDAYLDRPVGWRSSFIAVYPEGKGPTHWMPLPAAPSPTEADK